MRGYTRYLDASLHRISQRFGTAWIRWIALIILGYGISSTLLVPIVFRQKLIPALVTQTGASFKLEGARWNPFSLTLSLDGVFIGTSPEDPLISADHLYFDIGLLRSLIYRAVAIDAISISKPNIHIHPTRRDSTNLDDLMAASMARSTETSPKGDSSPLRFAVSRFEVEEGQISYAPLPNRLPLDIHSLALDVHDLRNWGLSETVFSVSLHLDDKGEVRAKGTFHGEGSNSQIKLEAHDVNLARLQSQLPVSGGLPDIDGQLDVSAHCNFQLAPDLRFRMEHAHAELRNVRLSRPQANLPLLTLGKLSLAEGLFDFADHRVNVESFEVKGLGLISLKGQDDQPLWLSLLPSPTLSKTPSAVVSGENQQAPSPWKLGIHHLNFSDLHLIQTVASSSSYQPDIQLGAIEGEELDVDLGAHVFAAHALELDDSKILLGLDHDAILPMNALMPLSPVNPQNKVERAVESRSWTIRIDKTEVSNLRVGVIRFSAMNPIPFELKNMDINLGVIDTRNHAETPLEVTSELSSGGTLGVNGHFNMQDQRFDGEFRLDRIGLKPLKSLLSESFRFDTVEGFLSSQLQIKASLNAGGLNGDYAGEFGLDGFRLTQAPGDRKLLGWRSLHVEGIKGRLNPLQFSANEIRLLDPDAVIAIHEDKSSNLSDLRVSSVPERINPLPTKSTGPEPDLHIRRIRVEGGKLDYTDQSLVLPFSTRVDELKGAITGLTLDPNGKSLLELNGRIAPYGEAAIHGQLKPRDPKSSMDVDLHFENVVLASLTPYSATFAGRRIENGRLDINAHYQIEDQELKSVNRIYLKQLQLGKKVESPKAVSLPLDLAVALLSDAEGNIELSLPIDGRTDAPDFDYGTVILNALGNLIKKAVLSPFTAMSGALGLGGGEGLDAIAFDLGSDVLTPPEKEKIVRLADALSLKPQLQLTLNGVFEPQKDLLVLRQSWVRQVVASRLGESSKPGEDPDPVNPTEPSTQRVLEALAKEHQLLDSALARYVLEKGHPADRVGLVGSLMGRGSKTPDFYEALVELIADQAPLESTALKKLAERRIHVVREALIASRKPVAAQRIRSGVIEEQSSEDGHHLLMPLTLQVE